ncbi:MAG: hypothetical protein D6689_12885 [Deltaproteobacteria bacterium]|nr:MAG: hypothetical protein D6689_12885 [Deltaproteobacteria bacterium]
MADEEKDVEEQPAAKASKIVPILLVLNLAVTAFVCARVMALPTDPEITAIVQPAAPDEGPGEVVELEKPFVVNLNEPKGGRYLKVQLAVEVADSDAAADLKKREQLVRDDLLRYLSGLSVEQTMGEENKNTIHDQIVARIDDRLGKGRVKRVFFEEFVVQ